MTVQHATQVFEADGFQTPAQRLVLLELAYRADRKGIVRRSQSEIAAACALSRATVAQFFREFEDCGILSRESHGRYRLESDAFVDTDDGGIADLLRRDKPITPLPGAEEEGERLRQIMRPDQGIVYTNRGWPVLRSM